MNAIFNDPLIRSIAIYGPLYALLVLSWFLIYRHQKYLWNGGVCRENGLPWEFVDLDPGVTVMCHAGGVFVVVLKLLTNDRSNLAPPPAANPLSYR